MHHTTRHSEQDPFPDQLKTAWFCLTTEFFVDKGRQDVPALPTDKKGKYDGKLTACFTDVYDKGVKIIKDNFKSKIYDCFPDLRYRILTEDHF